MKIKTQKTKILLGVACLIFLTSSFPFVQALTIPIPNQLVVRLEDSQAVNEAIVNLEQNLPNLVVLDYDSAEYKLKYWRFLGVAIWVSHGSEEGVMINGELTQWDVLEGPIKGTPNKDIVLSCYSSSLLEQTDLSSANVATFDNEVDALIGSFIVSYVLSQDSSILPKLSSRVNDIIANPSCVEPLVILLDDGGGGGGSGSTSPSYVIGHMSSIELTYWLLTALVLYLLILANCYINESWSFVQKTVYRLASAGWIGIAVTFIALKTGSITLELAIPIICSWVIDAIGILIECFYEAPLWERLLLTLSAVFALIALTIELLGDTVSAGAVTIGKFLAATASIMVFCLHFYQDYEDINIIVG